MNRIMIPNIKRNSAKRDKTQIGKVGLNISTQKIKPKPKRKVKERFMSLVKLLALIS